MSMEGRPVVQPGLRKESPAASHRKPTFLLATELWRWRRQDNILSEKLGRRRTGRAASFRPLSRPERRLLRRVLTQQAF